MSTRQPRLLPEARRFADWLNRLLNGTVTEGVRLRCWETGSRALVTVSSASRIPLAVGRRKAPVSLALRYTLGLDDSETFLMVKESYIGLYAGAHTDDPLLHYDYERNKAHGYPEAHVQVNTSSAEWDQLSPGRPFAKLHLPTGGRRNRPTLEDLLSFLIVERLVRARPGWKRLIDAGRDGYQRIQMAAWMRSRPDDALTIAKEIQELPPATASPRSRR